MIEDNLTNKGSAQTMEDSIRSEEWFEWKDKGCKGMWWKLHRKVTKKELQNICDVVV